MTFQPPHVLANSFASTAAKVSAWEDDRVAFFKAAVKNDTAGLDVTIRKYPTEWKQWKNKTGSILRCAQSAGSFEAFQLLIDRGADKDENYEGGWNPIMIAYKQKQTRFFDYLLEKGADLNETGNVPGLMSREIGLLHMAVLRKDKDTLIRLLEQGARTNVTATINTTIFGGMGHALYSADAEELATHKKLYVFADILKRANVIRADYLAAQSQQKPAPALPAAPVTPAALPQDDGKIDVMTPVQLRKKPGAETP